MAPTSPINPNTTGQTTSNANIGTVLQNAGQTVNNVENSAFSQANLANHAATLGEIAQLHEAFINKKINAQEFNAEMSRIAETVNQLSQGQKDYFTTQNENRGTAGENPLISNLISNATNRQQWQQQAADDLTSTIAANPLRQYNLDTDLKRQMAADNQRNLANNVTNQLTALSNARSINADMIKTAMQGGGAGLANTSMGTGGRY